MRGTEETVFFPNNVRITDTVKSHYLVVLHGQVQQQALPQICTKLIGGISKAHSPTANSCYSVPCQNSQKTCIGFSNTVNVS